MSYTEPRKVETPEYAKKYEGEYIFVVTTVKGPQASVTIREIGGPRPNEVGEYVTIPATYDKETGKFTFDKETTKLKFEEGVPYFRTIHKGQQNEREMEVQKAWFKGTFVGKELEFEIQTVGTRLGGTWTFTTKPYCNFTQKLKEFEGCRQKIESMRERQQP
jgi:hypothetical protein